MKERQQNSTDYPLTFLMVSSSDHISPVTGVTPTVTLSKNGGSFAAASGLVTEIGNGWYALAGNATDRNTLGELALHATATGADDTDEKYVVVPWNPFDANLGLTRLDAAVSADSAGVTTLLSRLTAARAGYLDTLNGLVAAVWAAVVDSPGVTMLLARLTATRATNLDHLDANVSSVGSGSAPTTSQIATAVETQLSGTHGSGAWGAAGATGAYSVPLRIQDANTVADLSGVLVSVYDSAGTSLVDQKRTNSAGVASFSLDSGSYKVRVAPQAGYSSLSDQVLTVTGNTATVTYALAPVSITNASPADTVTYYGYEYGSDGVTPKVGRKVKVIPYGSRPNTSGAVLLEGDAVLKETDGSGYWSVSLPRGKQFRILCAASGIDKTVAVSTDTAVTVVNIKDA